MLAKMIYPFSKWFAWKSDYITLKEDWDKLNNELKDLQGAYDLCINENNRLRDIVNEVQEKPIECRSYGTISLNEAYMLIRNATNCSNINLSDEYFQLTTIGEAKEFSKATKVQYRTWTKEDHDCDNFSFALMGYWSDELKSFAFGIAWSETHAFNIMIDKDKQVWIVEPQTNKYITMTDAKSAYIMNGGGATPYYPIRLVLM